jgi:hypothetical protein
MVKRGIVVLFLLGLLVFSGFVSSQCVGPSADYGEYYCDQQVGPDRVCYCAEDYGDWDCPSSWECRDFAGFEDPCRSEAIESTFVAARDHCTPDGSCTDECSSGDRGCSSDTVVWNCQLQSDGCWDRVDGTDCSWGNAVCYEGYCDTCSLVCLDADQVPCGDSQPALCSGGPCQSGTQCPAGETCQSGSCVTLSGCTPGDTRSCGTSTGVCSRGTQTCKSDRTWGSCVGDSGPTENPESTLCSNGLDDDCDGDTDCDDSSCSSNLACSGGCDTCGPEDSTRCSGNTFQTCTDVSGCLQWVDTNECAVSGEICVVDSGCEDCGDSGEQCCEGESCIGDPAIFTCVGNVCQGSGCSVSGDDLFWLYDGDEVSTVVEGVEVELSVIVPEDCEGVRSDLWQILDDGGTEVVNVLDEIPIAEIDDEGEISYLWEANQTGEDFYYLFRLFDVGGSVESPRLNVSEPCYYTASGEFIEVCDDYNDFDEDAPGARSKREACVQDCAFVGVKNGGKCRWDSTGGDDGNGECFFSTYGNNGREEDYFCRHDYEELSQCSQDQAFRVIRTNSTKLNESDPNQRLDNSDLDCYGSCNQEVCNIESPCPKVVQLPFLTTGNVIGIVILIIIIYILWSMAKKENAPRKAGKTKKKTPRKRGKKR